MGGSGSKQKEEGNVLTNFFADFGCGEDLCRVGASPRFAPVRSDNTQPIRSKKAGIGAIFGVDETGAVIFNSSITGSSSADSGTLMRGDVLAAIGDVDVYRAPLKMVSKNLSGPPGSMVKITILREGAGRMTFELERRLTDVELARKAVDEAQQETISRSSSSPMPASNSTAPKSWSGAKGGKKGGTAKVESPPQKITPPKPLKSIIRSPSS